MAERVLSINKQSNKSIKLIHKRLIAPSVRLLENSMRVVTWNCNRAFRKKAHKVAELNPDIVVVPESENPDTCREKEWLSNFAAWKWLGDNKNQGLGLFFRREEWIEYSDHCPIICNLDSTKLYSSDF